LIGRIRKTNLIGGLSKGGGRDSEAKEGMKEVEMEKK